MAKTKKVSEKFTIEITKSAGPTVAKKIRMNGSSEQIEVMEATLIIKRLGLKAVGEPVKNGGKTVYTYA